MTANTSAQTFGVDAATLLGMYEQMAVIRRTEKAAYDLFMTGKVKGTTHLAAGQEAVAVGANSALGANDYTFATYRGHHHVMARGADLDQLPYDLLQEARREGRTLRFNVAELFPALVPSVVRSVDRRWLDGIHAAIAQHARLDSSVMIASSSSYS